MRARPSNGSRRPSEATGPSLKFAPFKDREVKAVFESAPRELREPLMKLRQAILDTAAETPGVGALIETLKWREPAYLPKRPGTGTTVRINALKVSQDRYAMYVHCQTSLIATFRQHYPKHFTFEGNRAVLFRLGKQPPEAPLKHCIALALTYHRQRHA
jgi:hypothetical protein